MRLSRTSRRTRIITPTKIYFPETLLIFIARDDLIGFLSLLRSAVLYRCCVYANGAKCVPAGAVMTLSRWKFGD